MKEVEISENYWVGVLERPNYIVNCAGVVKSKDITQIIDGKRSKKHTRNRKGVILKQIDNGRGYLWVGFGRSYPRKYVHRIVATAFIPNPNKLPAVNHKDLNKSNNHYKNLEWVSHSDNSKHAFANGRCSLPKDSKGAKNGNSKLTADDIISIRKLQGKLAAPEIAAQFGITKYYVYNIFKRIKWGHLK